MHLGKRWATASRVVLPVFSCATLLAACNAILGITGPSAGSGGGGGASTVSSSASGSTMASMTTSGTSSGGGNGSVSASSGASSSSATASSGAGGGKVVSCDGGGPQSTNMLAPYTEAQAGGYDTFTAATVTAVAPGGGVVMAGNYFNGGVDFGLSSSLDAPPGAGVNIFVAKFIPSGSGGSWAFAEAFQSSGLAVVTGMVLDAQGNIVLAGYFTGSTLNFGATTLTAPDSVDGGPDVSNGFVAKLDASGNPLWALGFGNGGVLTWATSVALDSSANVVVAGVAQVGATLAFGGGSGPGCAAVAPPAVWTSANAGTGYPFVAKLGPDGSCAWAGAYAANVGFTSPYGLAGPVSLAIDGSDDVLISGTSQFQNNFGTTVDSPDPQNNDSSWTTYVAKLSGQNGMHVWDEAFGSSNGSDQQFASALALDPCGDILMAGTFNGNVQFDALRATLPNADHYTQTLFLAKLTPSGQAYPPLSAVWLRAFGDIAAGSSVNTLLVDSADHVLIAGNVQDGPGATGLSFGSGPSLVNTADDPEAGSYVNDVYFALLDGAGNYVRGKRTSCPSMLGVTRAGDFTVQLAGKPVALDGHGNIFVAGELEGTCSFAPGTLAPLAPAGLFDLFLVADGP